MVNSNEQLEFGLLSTVRSNLETEYELRGFLTGFWKFRMFFLAQKRL